MNARPRCLDVVALLTAAWITAPSRAAEPAADPLDGKSLAGWTTASGKPVTAGWEVADGTIHLKKKAGGGNIVTAREFRNFSLSFEWKIAPGGNSGIKYRVRNYDGKQLGLEYQIFDDTAGKKPPEAKNSAGSLYDLYGPSAAKKLKPVGEYNTAKIVVRGNQIEHWLNGERIVTATVGSSEWRRRIADSKFNDVPGFAQNPSGKLMLTDHGSEVWLRNFEFETYADSNVAGRSARRPLQRLFRHRLGR